VGIRGPKAKPVRLELVRSNEAKQRPRWQARGLSRPHRVLRFIESLPYTQGYGAGGPLFMHPFQQDIASGIYGPSRPDGGRLVRTALITMPRKQVKSTLAAALCMSHLCGPDGRE
jgi:hypothetical protein